MAVKEFRVHVFILAFWCSLFIVYDKKIVMRGDMIEGIRGETPDEVLFLFCNVKGFRNYLYELQFLLADFLLVGPDKFKQLNKNNEFLLLRQFGIDIATDS